MFLIFLPLKPYVLIYSPTPIVLIKKCVLHKGTVNDCGGEQKMNCLRYFFPDDCFFALPRSCLPHFWVLPLTAHIFKKNHFILFYSEIEKMLKTLILAALVGVGFSLSKLNLEFAKMLKK